MANMKGMYIRFDGNVALAKPKRVSPRLKMFGLLAGSLLLPLAAIAGGIWQVMVDGVELPLHACRAEVWAPYAYASFEVKGGEKVSVTAPDGTIEAFTVEKPFVRVFDKEKRKNVLVLFGNRADALVPNLKSPKVKAFGPGEHHIGPIHLKSGETLYLAPGAVVHGALYAEGRDITVTGRGILTGVDYEKFNGPFPYFTYFNCCTNLVIRGVTLTEPYFWTLVVNQSRNVLIEDVRLCCGNILNDDGIDLVNTSDVTVRRAFIRVQDDVIAVKGNDSRPFGERSPCENILVEDCVFWTDKANVFRIGYECNAACMRNIIARNLDIHAWSKDYRVVSDKWANAIFWLQPSNGMKISDCLFEDIRISADGTDMPLVIAEPRVCRCRLIDPTSYSNLGSPVYDEYRIGGTVERVAFRDITVTGEKGSYRGEISVKGRCAEESIRDVVFENVTRFGETVLANSSAVDVGPFAYDVDFLPHRPVEEIVDRAFAGHWKYGFSDKTSLLHGCPTNKVKPACEFKNGIFDWYKGIPGEYGAGMGDCALNHGVAISGCVDRWNVLVRRGLGPDDPKMRETSEWAAKLAQGLLNLTSRHPYTGFVARGLCWEDGKSICSLSSIDQHTHWIHGLWRYAHSSMVRPEILAEIRRRVAEVAARMERRVVPETGYNFGLCDGRADPRGICKMWWGDDNPRSACGRLAAIYAAAYDLTADEHWRGLYERHAEVASVGATRLNEERAANPGWRWKFPAYCCLQHNSAFEVLLGCEKDSTRRARILEGMRQVAAEADFRAKDMWDHPGKTWYGMCADGELALAQLMTPGWPYDEIEHAIFDHAIRKTRSREWGTFDVVHFFAAYWRMKANEGRVAQ